MLSRNRLVQPPLPCRYGRAIADVLLGRTAPAGKLPVTFPARENQVNFTNLSWGGNHSYHQSADSVTSNHSEGLQVGYRWCAILKKSAIFFGCVFFLISSGPPHVLWAPIQ